MKIIKINKKLLKKNDEILKLDFPLQTYLLIDENYRILLGNSFVDLLNDEVFCVKIKNHTLLELGCYEFENEIVKENSIERIDNIVKEINLYIRNYLSKTEKLSLDLDLTEYRTIEETFFDRPPE